MNLQFMGFWRRFKVGPWLGVAFAFMSLSAFGSSSPKDAPGADVFDSIKVIKFRMEIASNWLALLPKSYSNRTVYVPATIREGDRVYEKVGVHLRGVSTFQPVEEKPNWTFKFNEYVPGQFFHGLRKIRLSNGAVDKTYLQEFLAAEFFQAAGVACPRVNFARVELNGRNLGLYVLIEGVTKDFLKQHFKSSDGNLYEGEEADIDDHVELDDGKRHQPDLLQLAMACKEPDLSKRFAAMQQRLNVEPFISMMALEVLIDSWDGYTLRANNYRVFCDNISGRASFIPHGVDRTFEDVPASLMPEMKGLVSKGLVETPEGRKRYIARLGEIYSQLLDKEKVRARLAEVTAKIKPTLVEVGEDRLQARALLVFQRRVNKRIEHIGKELPRLKE